MNHQTYLLYFEIHINFSTVVRVMLQDTVQNGFYGDLVWELLFTAREDGSGIISMLGYISLNVRQFGLNC